MPFTLVGSYFLPLKMSTPSNSKTGKRSQRATVSEVTEVPTKKSRAKKSTQEEKLVFVNSVESHFHTLFGNHSLSISEVKKIEILESVTKNVSYKTQIVKLLIVS